MKLLLVPVIGAGVYYLLFIWAMYLLGKVAKENEEEYAIVTGYQNKNMTKKQKMVWYAFAALGYLFTLFLLIQSGICIYTVFLFLFYCLLTVIAFTDIVSMEIPFILNILILALGIVNIFIAPNVTIKERVIGMLCVSVPLLIITLLVPGAFGGGDIKMMFAAGAFLGFKATIAGFFIGLVLGGAYGIFVLVTKRKGRKEHFAFGPFLSMGLYVGAIWGEWLLNAYIKGFFPAR